MTDDDEMWTQLRGELAAGDVDPATAAAIVTRAHARLRNPHRTLSTALRSIESLAIAGIVVAQIAWAWSVVLG